MLPIANKRRSNGEHSSGYATHSDFCAIFRQQLDSLYLLALLLTGDEASAEKCFLAAFDSCVEGGLVFKERAVRWSRRSVIKTAIRFTLPAPINPCRPDPVANRSGLTPDQDTSLQCVRELALFDRFVFVMSVLERYSDRECALLLGCSCTDILAARIHALQQISRLQKSFPGHGNEAKPYVLDGDGLKCG